MAQWYQKWNGKGRKNLINKGENNHMEQYKKEFIEFMVDSDVLGWKLLKILDF